MQDGLGIRGVLVAGPAGAGKTTVGRILAQHLGWGFRDADDLHPAGNIFKMRSGVPLTDADRRPWLASVGASIDAALDGGGSLVMACSLLRRSYSDFLLAGRDCLRLAFLHVERSVLAARLSSRPEHFFPPALLDSQLEMLELPGAGQLFDGNREAIEVAREIASRFGLEWG